MPNGTVGESEEKQMPFPENLPSVLRELPPVVLFTVIVAGCGPPL